MVQFLILIIVIWIVASVLPSMQKPSQQKKESWSNYTAPEPKVASITKSQPQTNASLRADDVFPESRKMIEQSRQSLKNLSEQECFERWGMGLGETENFLAGLEEKLNKFIALDKDRDLYLQKAFSCKRHWEKTPEYRKHLILPLAEVMVGNHSRSIRLSAAGEIYLLGSHSVALPYLYRALDDEEILVVSRAIKSLGETGPADSAAITGKIVPALMEILKSNKRYENNVTHEKLPETVGSALRSLAAGGVLSEQDVHLMFSGLSADLSQEARQKLAKAIWISGAKAKAVLPHLIEMNLFGLPWRNLSQFDSDTVQLLIDNLYDADEDISIGVADGLIELALSMADGELNGAIINRIQEFKAFLLERSDLADPDLDELIGTQVREHIAGYVARGGVGKDYDSRQRFLRHLAGFVHLERIQLSDRDKEQIIKLLSKHVDVDSTEQLDEEYELDFIQHFCDAVSQAEGLDYVNKRRLVSRLDDFLAFLFGSRAGENQRSSLRQRLLAWFTYIGGRDEVASLIFNSFEDHIYQALLRTDLTELNPDTVNEIEDCVCAFFREIEAKRIGVQISGCSHFQIVAHLISWSENFPNIELRQEQCMKVRRLLFAIEYIHEHGPGSRNDRRSYSGAYEDLRQEAKDLEDYIEFVQNH